MVPSTCALPVVVNSPAETADSSGYLFCFSWLSLAGVIFVFTGLFIGLIFGVAGGLSTAPAGIFPIALASISELPAGGIVSCNSSSIF